MSRRSRNGRLTLDRRAVAGGASASSPILEADGRIRSIAPLSRVRVYSVQRNTAGQRAGATYVGILTLSAGDDVFARGKAAGFLAGTEEVEVRVETAPSAPQRPPVATPDPTPDPDPPPPPPPTFAVAVDGRAVRFLSVPSMPAVPPATVAGRVVTFSL